jgi:hypothetical protein
MLEARIITPRGSLYYASEPTPYDLQTLRQHLREVLPERGDDDVTLELTVDDGPGGPAVSDWLRSMLSGVRVRVLRQRRSDHAA